MRILVAENEPVDRKMLEGLLVTWDYEVIAASDGHQALQILQQDNAPMLAILDWNMPGLTGPEVCEQIRQIQTPAPPYIILQTVRTANLDLMTGRPTGANDYLRKPFDVQELQARVAVGRSVIELQSRVARRMQEFEDYVEDSPLGILLVEEDGSISFANRRAYSIFGYMKGELIGQLIESLVPNSDRSHHATLRDAYFKEPQTRMMADRGSLFGQRKDGSLVSVAVGLNPIPRQAPRKVATTVVDLTELRHAEENLQQFFDLSLDLLCIASLDGFLLKFNPTIVKLLSYSEEELKSRTFFDFFHPADVPLAKAEVGRLAAGEDVTEFRCRSLAKDGTVFWIEWNARAVLKDGTIYAVGRNVTERLRAENALKYRENREHALLNHTPAIICIKDVNGRYEFVNQKHAELFSGNPLTAIGKTASHFFAEAEAARISREEQHIIRTGETLTTTETAWQADGTHTFVSVKFPLRDSSGTVSATACISTDVTEQLRARHREQELGLARSFQRKLYPNAAPVIQGIDAAGSAVPLNEMCGDYFDYIQIGPQRLLVSIGDVSGHGVGPALEMAQVRCAARLLARHGAELPEIMHALNIMLCEDLPESSFVSFFLVDLDVENHRFRYIGAGHDACLIHGDGTLSRLNSTHMVLGIERSLKFRQVPWIDIHPGDLLFLFTDGLTEARNANGDEYGRQLPVDIVCRNRQEPSNLILQELFLAVYEFTSGRNLKDDMTAVVVKVIE